MDVGEEVVVGEVVVGDRIVRDEAASSRAERSPKTLSPFSRTGLKRCGLGGLLSRPAVHAARRDGEELVAVQRSELCGERKRSFYCVSLERSDLSYIGTGEGREQAATGGEATEGDEVNRQHAKRCAVRIHYPLPQKLFSSQVTFRIPVVRGKN